MEDHPRDTVAAFDEELGKYVLNSEIMQTKSSDLIDLEISSLNRENFLLDSLRNDSIDKGLDFKIINYNFKSVDKALLVSVEDSTNVGPESPEDSLAIDGQYYSCGTLFYDTSYLEYPYLSANYDLDVSAFISIDHTRGVIYTLLYTTYHNFSVTTGNTVVVYTGDTGPGTGQSLPLCVGGNIQGPLTTVSLYYCNSDSLNKNSIVWRCDYCLQSDNHYINI